MTADEIMRLAADWAIAEISHAQESFPKTDRECVEAKETLAAAVRELERKYEGARKGVEQAAMVNKLLTERAEKAEQALAAECEVNMLHQAEIAKHMREVERLRGYRFADADPAETEYAADYAKHNGESR